MVLKGHLKDQSLCHDFPFSAQASLKTVSLGTMCPAAVPCSTLQTLLKGWDQACVLQTSLHAFKYRLEVNMYLVHDLKKE